MVWLNLSRTWTVDELPEVHPDSFKHLDNPDGDASGLGSAGVG